MPKTTRTAAYYEGYVDGFYSFGFQDIGVDDVLHRTFPPNPFRRKDYYAGFHEGRRGPNCTRIGTFLGKFSSGEPELESSGQPTIMHRAQIERGRSKRTRILLLHSLMYQGG